MNRSSSKPGRKKIGGYFVKGRRNLDQVTWLKNIEKKNDSESSESGHNLCHGVCELFVSMAEERLVGGLKFKYVYPLVIKRGLLKTPLYIEVDSWENYRSEWGIFQQATFDYQRVNQIGYMGEVGCIQS